MSLFLTRIYGPRKLTHFAYYQADIGWWRLELASWTLEVGLVRPSKRTLWRTALLALVWCLPTPATILKVIAL